MLKEKPVSSNGKGDRPRPIKDREQYDKNYDVIFNKKDKNNENLEGNRLDSNTSPSHSTSGTPR